MPTIKGFAIRGVLKYLKETHPGHRQQVLDGLLPATKKALERPVIASQWYPYAVFLDLVRTVDQVAGKGDLNLCEAMGDFAARNDITGIFKIMMSILTPRLMLQRGHMIWTKYCDTGRFVTEKAANNEFAVRLLEFPQIDLAHCRLILGWLRRWSSLTGVSSVEVRHTVCAARKGAFCEFEGSWKD